MQIRCDKSTRTYLHLKCLLPSNVLNNNNDDVLHDERALNYSRESLHGNQSQSKRVSLRERSCEFS